MNLYEWFPGASVRMNKIKFHVHRSCFFAYNQEKLLKVFHEEADIDTENRRRKLTTVVIQS